MKHFIAAVAFTTICSIFPSAAVGDDFDDVAVTVGKYFTGTEQGRPDLLEEAILPSLEVQLVAPEGKLRRITSADFVNHFKPGKKVDRKGHIVSMDVSGNAATVKVEIISGERIYTDYLLLLKLDNVWRISNKIVSLGQR